MKKFLLRYFGVNDVLKEVTIEAEDSVRAMKICMNLKDCYEINGIREVK